ncbi:MAG TPA: head maturation protease, ClpP-related, partial [Pseudonocardiaceae bacterium]
MASVWQHLRNRDQRPHPQLPDGRGQVRITDEAGVAEVYLYDEIGFWGVMATDFVEQLIGIAASKIVLHVNSPGGDVFDGLAIYNALCDHPASIDVRVDGLAASAASFISMAGDNVVMNRGAQMMIHDASGLCIGNAADMADMQALLDRVSDTIAGVYAARAGGEAAAWRTAMRAETWYSPAEAVTAGLADSAVAEKPGPGEQQPAARFDLAMTSFQFAGRAAAPRPAMPGRDRPADEQPDGPGVDAADEEGGGSAPRTEPTAPPPAPD